MRTNCHLSNNNIGYEEREVGVAHDLATSTSRFVTVRRVARRSIDNRERRKIGARGKHRCYTARRFTFLLISSRRRRRERGWGGEGRERFDETRARGRVRCCTTPRRESPRRFAERKSPYRKITKSFGFHAEVSTSNNSGGSLAPARFSRTCTPPFKSIGTRSPDREQPLENSEFSCVRTMNTTRFSMALLRGLFLKACWRKARAKREERETFERTNWC